LGITINLESGTLEAIEYLTKNINLRKLKVKRKWV